MSIKDAIGTWGSWVLGGLAFVGTIWNRLGLGKKLQSLHAQWDGFKVEYDKLNRSDARKEGELAARDRDQDRNLGELHRQEDRQDRKNAD